MTWLAADDLLGPVPLELDLQLKLTAGRLGTDRLALAASALLEGHAGALARLVDGPLAVLVARLAERPVRRGPRALWGLVANGCAAALVEEARLAGLPDGRVEGLLGRLLRSAGRPLPAPALLRVGPDGGRLVRRRVTCCLNYTVAPGPCATCPLLPPAETGRRLAAG